MLRDGCLRDRLTAAWHEDKRVMAEHSLGVRLCTETAAAVMAIANVIAMTIAIVMLLVIAIVLEIEVLLEIAVMATGEVGTTMGVAV